MIDLLYLDKVLFNLLANNEPVSKICALVSITKLDTTPTPA